MGSKHATARNHTVGARVGGAGLAGTVGTAQAATTASATAASTQPAVCETGWGSLEKHLWSADDHKPR